MHRMDIELTNAAGKPAIRLRDHDNSTLKRIDLLIKPDFMYIKEEELELFALKILRDLGYAISSLDKG